jgi:hypothetical protein
LEGARNAVAYHRGNRLKKPAKLWIFNRQDFVGSRASLAVQSGKNYQFPLSKSLSLKTFLDVVNQNNELVAGKYNLKKKKR